MKSVLKLHACIASSRRKAVYLPSFKSGDAFMHKYAPAWVHFNYQLRIISLPDSQSQTFIPADILGLEWPPLFFSFTCSGHWLIRQDFWGKPTSTVIYETLGYGLN
jgi:hypothetical protein